MLSARKILLALIRGYQIAISPMLGAHCRFHPTCSAYTQTAVERFGVVRGTWLGVRRICRCHPFCDGGYDPVPDEKFLHG
jgi:putative membrane protein insertion efficiency factor